MIIDIFIFTLLVLFFLCLIRLVLGPTVADRMVAIDILGILVVGICAVMVIQTGRTFIMDIAIAWIILSFLSNLALAKYLSGKNYHE